MKPTNHLSAYHTAFTAAFKEVLGNLEEMVNPKASEQPDGRDGYVQLLALCCCLENGFKGSCACGLAQQIGRSAFTHLLRGRQELDGLMDQSFRLLPGKQRQVVALEWLDRLVEEAFGIPVAMIDSSDMIQLETKADNAQHDLIPHLEAGFVQEFFHWVSGGNPHPVSVNRGQPGWSVLVCKQPLDS